MQAVILLIFCCYWYGHASKIKYLSSTWINDINLIYVKDFIESLQLGLPTYSYQFLRICLLITLNRIDFISDPKKGLVIIIVLTSIYIAISLLYVYGAYKVLLKICLIIA